MPRSGVPMERRQSGAIAGNEGVCIPGTHSKRGTTDGMKRHPYSNSQQHLLGRGLSDGSVQKLALARAGLGLRIGMHPSSCAV